MFTYVSNAFIARVYPSTVLYRLAISVAVTNVLALVSRVVTLLSTSNSPVVRLPSYCDGMKPTGYTAAKAKSKSFFSVYTADDRLEYAPPNGSASLPTLFAAKFPRV